MKKNSLLNFLSDTGYKRNSPDVNRPLNVIPSGRITMQDVDFPVRGVDNLGNEMFMMPGGEYFFPGDYVVETPMMQRGGLTFQQYYTPASESTGANYTPTMTVQAAERLKAMRDAQELARRKQAIQASQAAASRSFRERLTPENLAQETGATGDKLRFFPNDPDSFIDDYLNPLKMVGDMASGLGRIPLNVKQGNYGAAALDVAIPVATGALAGLGAKSAGQFVNNLANPLAGTGQFLTTKTPLKNAYKYNPWAFKPKEGMMYRGIGKEGMEDAIQSGVFRQKAKRPPGIPDESGIRLRGKGFGETYFSPEFSVADRYGKGFIAEVPKKSGEFKMSDSPNHASGWSQYVESPIPISEGRILQKDWLRGYKPIDVPSAHQSFKSEIDWAKWNPETATHKVLMDEYNAIEESTKKAGTWMKNSDGTAFQGTPEQFIQQQSSWFKKAFPEGFENVFRGVRDKNVVKELNPERSMFTADFDLASNYTRNNEILTPFDQFNTLDKSQFNPNVKEGMFNLAHKKSPKSVELDNFGKEWTSIDLTNPKQSVSNIELNIKHLEKQLERQKEFLKSGKQNPDGSWSFPDTDIVYSNQLYQEGTTGQEKIINSYKDRLKNINNLVKNEKELEKMKSVLGDKTTTDDIAKYIEDSNLDYVKIKNVDDSGLGDVSIVNHKKGNYLKSLVGNVGFFDMTNPNIFKSIFPYLGAGALQETPQYQKGGQQVGTDILDKYKSYIMGDYKPEEEKDLKNTYDKLNRHYYKKAKETGKSVPNYIMSLL